MTEQIKLKPFVNPYLNVPEEQLVRMQTSIDGADYRYPQALRLSKGTINTTVNILFKKLVTECRRRGMVDFTNCDEFETFVANCAIVAEDEVDLIVYNKLGVPTNKKAKRAKS